MCSRYRRTLILNGSKQEFPVVDGVRVVGVITRNGLLKALAGKNHQLVRDVMHRDIAMVDASGGSPESGHLAAGGGGSAPPSASVFMFFSACANLARRASLSTARAVSSGSIELSKNKV